MKKKKKSAKKVFLTGYQNRTQGELVQILKNAHSREDVSALLRRDFTASARIYRRIERVDNECANRALMF